MKLELLKELDKAMEMLKDFSTFKHLFSKDKAEVILAELSQTVGRLGILIVANDLKDLVHPKNHALQDSPYGAKTGSLVSVRPCGEEYNKKTFIGFYIGDVALGSSISVTEGKIQLNFANHNPAIFVPELGKIIYGCESWWGEIESEEELRKITDDDIQNVWYVKLWKEMAAREKKEPETPQT